MKSTDVTISPESQNKMQSLIDLVENFVPVNKWGFTQDTLFAGTSQKILPYVIYNSKSCRVKFLLDYSGNGRKLDLRVFYGRAHALNDMNILHWNGGEYYCWHNFEMALKFLDGISPKKAVNTQGSPSLGIQEFLDTGFTNNIEQPEWLARMHATAWEYYGNRLFQLFDLSHPELWAQFTRFMSEYYDILGRNPAYNPSLDKIC
jgi:hypothetical protein